MRIGALAQNTGTTAPTIRYYEEVGLLPRPGRREGGQRRYGSEDVARLTFIRRCRAFGFSIEQVRALVQVMGDSTRDCREALALAERHLADVRAKLFELRALEGTLSDFVRTCEGDCEGGPGPDCAVLQELAMPAAAPSRRGTLA